MFAIVRHLGRPRALYTHEELAWDNVTNTEDIVVSIDQSVDTTSVIWNNETKVWESTDRLLTIEEIRKQHEDYRVRRAQLYYEQINTALLNEVVLDVVLVLVNDPNVFAQLRTSTQEKLNSLVQTINEIKARNPEPTPPE